MSKLSTRDACHRGTPVNPMARSRMTDECDKPFEMLDIDKDGKVLRDEVPKQLQAIFDRMDKNTDGVLEKTELPQ